MRKLIFIMIMMFSVGIAIAQTAEDVTYLEKQGTGGSRVFSVSVPVTSEKKMPFAAQKAVIKAILFDGVEGYNNGEPLVQNPSDSYANSILDEKNLVYTTFCKETHLENSNYKNAGHYIVIVNHYNLTKTLKMRRSMTGDFKE